VPWHTSRSVVTAAGDALIGCTDAYGKIAADVAALSRPEIAELAEGSGGGSSTMPQKHNPVLSEAQSGALGPHPAGGANRTAACLDPAPRRRNQCRRTPGGILARRVGTLRDLARRTVAAASQASELITGLVVDEDRIAANLAAAAGIEAEQPAMADLVGAEPSKEYLGATELIIDRVLARAGQRPGVV
jgi:3-carboxy-cis,cis-muconate cycloisomerase